MATEAVSNMARKVETPEPNILIAREIDKLRNERDLLATRLRNILDDREEDSGAQRATVMRRARETLVAIYGPGGSLPDRKRTR